MDVSALSFLLSSCKCDIENIHDTLFQSTLTNYGQPDSAQYISAINKINIEDIILKLNALMVKRDLINSLVFNSSTNIYQRDNLVRSDSIDSFRNGMRRSNSNLRNVSSTGSLLFPIDDIL